MNSEHFRCTCLSHAISVSRFEDYPEIEVEFWLSHGTRSGWRGLRQRVVDAWKILTTGTAPMHGVFLTEEDAGRMGRKLVELSERKDQHEA